MSNNSLKNDDKSGNNIKSEFLYTRKSEHLYEGSADDKFDVIIPKKNSVVLIVFFLGLFFAQFFYFSGLYYQVMYPNLPYKPEEFFWWVPLIFLAIAFIPILAWGQFGSRFASKSIVKYLKKTVERKRPKPFELVLGYPFRTKDIYYLEAYPVDLNLGSDFAHTKVFIKRVLEVLFLCLGMSVVIAQLIAPYIWTIVYAYDPDMYFNIEEMIIDMTIYLGPFALMILLFVMPVFWISEDTQAYRINEYQDTMRIGYYLRTGVLSKILGFFGLVLVFNLSQQFASALLIGEAEISYSEFITNPIVAFQVYSTTLIWFLLIMSMCTAIPFLVSLVYLSFFHERWVNNVRIRASEFMPLGTLQVKHPEKIGLKYLNNQEMIDETGGFFQKTHGTIILLALIIVASIICFYMAFVLGFEKALFPFL